MSTPTCYQPFDGDYIDEDYEKLLDDLQTEAGYDFGEFLEIIVSLEGDNNDTLYVCGSNNEGTEWIWQQGFPIPSGWNLERLEKMFEGNVYLKPSTRQVKKEN